MSEIQKAANVVSQLIKDMDAKFTRWNIYRCATNKWVLDGEQSTQQCEITSDGFVEALQMALEWRALPLVPRPKERYYRNAFQAKKNGAKWRLDYLGRDCGVQFSTKKDAEACADRKASLSISESESWELMYGWSKDKVEGVDFRWAK